MNHLPRLAFVFQFYFVIPAFALALGLSIAGPFDGPAAAARVVVSALAVVLAMWLGAYVTRWRDSEQRSV